MVPVPEELEMVGGGGVGGGHRCESAVREAVCSHLHLPTPESVARVAGGQTGGPAGRQTGGISISQDDPRLGGTLEVWLGICPTNILSRFNPYIRQQKLKRNVSLKVLVILLCDISSYINNQYTIYHPICSVYVIRKSMK